MTLPGESILTQAEWDEVVKSFALSTRQAQIAHMIMQGCTDRQIAEELGIAHATVRTHLKQVFARARVADRNEMILAMVRQSMVNDRSRASTA